MQQDGQFTAPVMDDGRYKLLVDNIADYAIYMLNPDGIVTSWNAGARRFKGYTADEIIGQHFSRFYTPEDRTAGLPAQALETSLREGKFEAEGWRVRKDGSRFWANVIIDPVRDESGSFVGFAKVTRDLTERKKAEEHLRTSEQQFRLLVQSVTDYAIYMLDARGYVSNWNAGAERIKGYKPAEIVGKHFSRFYTDEDRARGEPERALRTAADEERYAMEGWRCRKDGTQFWASVVIDPIRDDNGALLGFAKITRDVTERRDAEKALEQTREALFQAQKMEAIGQLTGGVAHDFNNLLGAVLGSLELAMKRLSGADERVLALLQNAMEGAKRGATLTQRMLAFARRQDLKPSSIDVHGLVDGMADLMQRSLGPRVRFENRVPANLQRIKADANQVEMALLNLTMNARDAMPGGGPIVVDASEARIDRSDEPGIKPGTYVCLSVTDNGEGMDAETLRKAAEPFFTTKGIGKGTGLGLPMVKGLAEQSGGHFKLFSTEGQGTRAELWLPVAEEEASAANDAEAGNTERRRKRRALTVLAVDDDALVLMNTVAMLEELGHDVLEAYSGAKALEILRSEKQVDVVVIDQAMPGMTGLELGRAIHDKWPGTRLVLATGYGELPADADVRFAKLSKPFMERDLSIAIEQAPHAAGIATRVRNLVGI